MSKPQVLIVANPKKGVVWSKEEQKTKLGAVAEVIEFDSPSREAFLKECKEDGKYGKVVAIYRHNESASAIGVFDKELVEGLPKSLKYLCHNGAGYDQIDIEACTARNIQVAHTPMAVDHGTATVGAYLTIGALRQFYRAEVNVRNGKWKNGLVPARDPQGKVLGIIGMGGIGSTMAKMLIPFDMTVIYYNRKEISPKPDFPCEYVSSQEELLKRSDVVSLNLPLNAKTEGSFGKAQFDQMKDGSVLINTARGAVVNEEAFLEALDSGKLFSAGIDVFPDEPNVNQRLIDNDKITILPHMGTETSDSQKKMELRVFDNIISAIQGNGLINQVHEQK